MDNKFAMWVFSYGWELGTAMHSYLTSPLASVLLIVIFRLLAFIFIDSHEGVHVTYHDAAVSDFYLTSQD